MLARVVSAVIALIIVLPVMIWGGIWGMIFLSVVSSLFAVYEFSFLSRAIKRYDLLFLESLLSIGLILIIQFYVEYLHIYIGFSLIVLFIWHLLTISTVEDSSKVLFGSISSVFYFPALISFLPLLRNIEPNGLMWMFFLLLVTWSGDTGAYLSGKTFGKHKLYPKISPGKTVEGVLGGVFFSALGAVIAKLTFLEGITFTECIVLVPLLNIVGVLGDLSESMLKRSSGIKDSGNLFPGHGGILDRLDSLLFTAPVLYTYLLISRF